MTAIATPINSAKLVNGTPAGASSPNSPNASSPPSKNGTIMLACEIATAAWACDRSCPGLNSNPTRNMYRITPSWAMIERYGATSPGKSGDAS